LAGSPEPKLPRHHLYLVVENNKARCDHWLLRDLLRSDADARARYAALKAFHRRATGIPTLRLDLSQTIV